LQAVAAGVGAANDDAVRCLNTAEARKKLAERRRDEAEAKVEELLRAGASAELIAHANAVAARRDGDVVYARTAYDNAFALYASLVARPRPVVSLSMDDVNAWLTANPLAVAQSAPPTSALWWRLGDRVLNADAPTWFALSNINVFLLGVSGAGKTRSVYELLAHDFGFYWTCSCAGNGGARIVEQRLDPLLLPNLGDAHRADVGRLVQFLVCAYSILLLQWRRANPRGSALDWLVFQTTAAVVDRALEPIAAYLSSCDISELVDSALLAAKNCDGVGDLFLVVDEAQVLAQFGTFSSANLTIAKDCRLLSPFASFCGRLSFRSVWFAGTSMSLGKASEVVESKGFGKKRTARLVECAMVFEELSPFKQYLTEMVGVEFSETLIGELHARFKGRARCVAVLAEYLIADGVAAVVADAEEFHERVMDVAMWCESDLLWPSDQCRTSSSKKSSVSMVSPLLNDKRTALSGRITCERGSISQRSRWEDR
jgi:hypothetical protein